MALGIKNGEIVSVEKVERGNTEYYFIKYKREDGKEFNYPLLFPVQNDVKSWAGKYLQVYMDNTRKIEEITDKQV